MELQELITRGRYVFSNSPKRLDVFKLVNGRRNTKEIATKSGRGVNSALNDLKMMRDYGLIEPKIFEGQEVKKDGCLVYEKVPMLRHIPFSYFEDKSKGRLKVIKKENVTKGTRTQSMTSLSIPTENEILDICNHGEDQIYEFKEPGVATRKISREVAAFLHTKKGGLLFYGVADDGSIIGSDKSRQDIDQTIQNSIRNTISPQPNIEVKEINVMGQSILIITIPAWDRKTLYQYTKDNRYYIRKGTNVFALKPEEIAKLGKGEYVV